MRAERTFKAHEVVELLEKFPDLAFFWPGLTGERFLISGSQNPIITDLHLEKQYYFYNKAISAAAAMKYFDAGVAVRSCERWFVRNLDFDLPMYLEGKINSDRTAVGGTLKYLSEMTFTKEELLGDWFVDLEIRI